MRNVLTKLAVAAAALVGGVTSANAYVILTITDLSTTATTTCNTLIGGCGLGWSITNMNLLSFSGTVGAFDVAATQGLANTPGNVNVAFANTTSLSVGRNDGAAGLKGLQVTFDAIDFTAPITPFKSMGGSASGTSGAGLFSPSDFVSSRFYVDSAGGTAFASPVTLPPGALTADGLYTTACSFFASLSERCDAAPITWADPSAPIGTFSARSEQSFSLNPNSVIQTTSSLTIRQVPEPMTTSLVGLALFGLALASRRTAAKKA
ncbi:MAG: hypothetical protein C0505_16455 [Leptothrix sp. (in: Bacteria)]|nr:hypothetical protein [Leptothrix sp. (in: b-proteobacteria)]